MPLGINLTGTPAAISADCAVVASLGAKWVRVSLEQSWTSHQSLDSLQLVVNAAHDHGLKVLQCCQGLLANQSATGHAGHFPAKNTTAAAAFGQWCAQCAAMADMVEVGNEWNGFGWDGKPDPHAAADLTIAALEADQTQNMVTGGMMPGTGVSEPLGFLQQMVGAQPLILSLTQGIGWHPYCFPQNPKTPESWNTCYKMRALHAWLQQLGHQGLKIWATEYGQPDGSGYALLNVAAIHLQQYFFEFDSQAAAGVRFGPSFLYTFRDRAFAPGDWSANCGLVDLVGAMKPTVKVFTTRAQTLTSLACHNDSATTCD